MGEILLKGTASSKGGARHGKDWDPVHASVTMLRPTIEWLARILIKLKQAEDMAKRLKREVEELKRERDGS